MYRQKMDISYCGDKTGFPRPGHICINFKDCDFYCFAGI